MDMACLTYDILPCCFGYKNQWQFTCLFCNIFKSFISYFFENFAMICPLQFFKKTFLEEKNYIFSFES